MVAPGATTGLGPMDTGAAVSVLALTAAVIQPWAGRALDAGHNATSGTVGDTRVCQDAHQTKWSRN